MTRYVPDELSLTMWRAAAPQSASVVLAHPLPAELVEPWSALRAELGDPSVVTVPSPLPHTSPAAHTDGEDGGPDGPDDGHHHGDHGHEDMMAITGDPSVDGLVMEPITFEHGPLAAELPGGLVLGVELDGDVVSQCEVRAILTSTALMPDPLTPAAWRAAHGESRESGWSQVAILELERALSHAAWLRSLARVLGWSELSDRCGRIIEAILGATDDTRRLESARAAAETLVGDFARSRRLHSRLAGRGRVTVEGAAGLQGPNARAAGQSRDSRLHDPRYTALDFEPVVEFTADALARTRVRMRELAQALQIAAVAFERTDPAPASGRPLAVEGPRGPLVASGHVRVAPGARASLSAAGTAAVGLEWASALAVVASFDLSPWQVTG